MPRKPRPLDRAGGVVRDASLIVIASEDTYAVEQYFHKFHTAKVLVEVLPTVDGKSSPAAVIERLADYARKWQIGGEDEIWACIDLDRRSLACLSHLIRCTGRSSGRRPFRIPKH